MVYNTKTTLPLLCFIALLLIVVGFRGPAFAQSSSDVSYQWAKDIGIGSTTYDADQYMVVDDSGNVYITGSFVDTADFDPGAGTSDLISNGDEDIFFAKYDADGNHLWSASIGSIGNDRGFCIAVSSGGDVYITGHFEDTADFDPGSGTANLTSSGITDIFFAKYNSNGNFLWAKSIGGPAWDRGYDMVLDTVGNVYITGYFHQGVVDFDPGVGIANLTSGGGFDIFFAKYDENGNYLWAKSIGGVFDDAGRSIAVDVDGNVCITGKFRNTADFDPGAGIANLTVIGMVDIFFAKYDPNGNYLWAKSIGSIMSDYGSSIVVDTVGNVYVTGYFQETADFDAGSGTANLTVVGSMPNIFFLKYDPNGNYLWAKNIDNAWLDEGCSMAVDTGGNVYITGFYRDTADFDLGVGTANLTSLGSSDIFFAKYDTDGNYQWAKSIGSSNFEEGTGILVGADDNVYVTGTFSEVIDFDPGPNIANLSPSGNFTIFFAKYSNTLTSGIISKTKSDYSGIKVYPNPTYGIFTVELDQQINTLCVYNILGELILETVSNSTKLAIDLTPQPRGIYQLQILCDSDSINNITSESARYQYRVIKQ